MITKESDDYRAHTFMQTLNWTRDFGDNHIDVLLDHENYQTYFNGFLLQKAGQSVDGRYDLNNFSEMMYNAESASMIRTESYLGRARYNYDQTYFGEFSIRRDGSSRLQKTIVGAHSGVSAQAGLSAKRNLCRA